MAYNAKVKLTYVNDTEPQYSKHFPEIVDQQTISVEAPAQDLNVYQYFSLFKSFLLAVGFNEYTVVDGACNLAFNDSNDETQMKKLMLEYELQDKQLYTDDEARAFEDEIRTLKAEVLDLKAKLSRFEQPDNPNYTDAEIDAMTAENEVTVETLQNADVVCKDCGSKYGTYSVGCSSTWEGKCGVCGQVKGVTETRDYGYLRKGIQELKK